MTQIDGGAAGGICSAPPEGVESVSRRATTCSRRAATLETKYQQMGRGLSASAVDQEGAAIWITEYLRYRTNGCGHAEAEAKVFSQIDGGPVPPTCFVPCSYVLSPDGRQHRIQLEHAGIRSTPGERRLADLHMDGAEHRARG